MNYLTYEKYQQHAGALSQGAFFIAEKRAEREIDSVTFGRVRAEFDGTQAYTDDLTVLMLGLCEEIAKADSYLASESCDGVSASYSLPSPKELIAVRARLIAIMLDGYKNKSGTPLLYKGVRQ